MHPATVVSMAVCSMLASVPPATVPAALTGDALVSHPRNAAIPPIGDWPAVWPTIKLGVLPAYRNHHTDRWLVVPPPFPWAISFQSVRVCATWSEEWTTAIQTSSFCGLAGAPSVMSPLAALPSAPALTNSIGTACPLQKHQAVVPKFFKIILGRRGQGHAGLKCRRERG
jgi:hypothetical protein